MNFYKMDKLKHRVVIEFLDFDGYEFYANIRKDA